MSNFISFTAEAATKPELGKEFSRILQDASPEKLYAWFKEKCFDVRISECATLVANKDEVMKADGEPWGPFQY
jgi:hypothetical protein